MTKELLLTLSTGDQVRNIKTDEKGIVVAQRQSNPYLKDISELKPVEDWEVTRSRFITTKEEWARIHEFHRKMAEQSEKKKH